MKFTNQSYFTSPRNHMFILVILSLDSVLIVSLVSKEFDSGIVNLVAADPLDACHSVNNGQALHGAIALVERGWVTVVESYNPKVYIASLGYSVSSCNNREKGWEAQLKKGVRVV